jgi:hypothetical protein
VRDAKLHSILEQIMSEATLPKTEQLDTLMRELHGCSFDEFVDKAMSLGFDEGLLEGHRIGRTDGSRQARGRKGRPKRRGKPSVIDDDLATLMLHEVSEAQKQGIAVKDAVIDVLERQEIGRRLLDNPSLEDAMIDLLEAQELGEKVLDDRKIQRTLEAIRKEFDDPRRRRTSVRFYHRIQTKGRSASSLQSSWDETLRAKIDLLKKQWARSPS